METLGNIVMALDEVLVNTAPYIYSQLRSNWGKYGLLFKNIGDLSEEKILKRTVKELDVWLLQDEYKEEYQTDLEFREAFAKELYQDIYMDNFYSELVPTSFAKKTLLGAFIENKKVQNVYIIDYYMTEIDKKYKEMFVEKYFNNDKITLILLPQDQNKVDYINKLEWSLMVEDDLDIIYEILENKEIECENKEFMIPEKGYNQNLIREKAILAALKNNSIVYYGDIKSSNIQD